MANTSELLFSLAGSVNNDNSHYNKQRLSEELLLGFSGFNLTRSLPSQSSLASRDLLLSKLNYEAASDELAFNYQIDQYSLPETVQIALFILYGINIIVSVLGNGLVILIFSYGRKSRTELSPFLINLAIADLTMALFCLPFTSTQVLLSKWIFPHFLCPLVSFMQHTSVSASIYTQTFISIDRLRSICRPFRRRLRVTKSPSQLLFILGFIWLWSLLQASVQFYVSQVQEDRFDQNDSTTAALCLETWPTGQLAGWPDDGQDWTSTYSRFYTVCVFSIDYVIPLLCIACAYSYVGRKLWERTTPGEASDVRDKLTIQSKRKVIKMLAMMVLSFGVLWLPLQTFFLLHDFSTVLTDLPPKYYHTLFVTCHYIAMLSVIVNIIIYVLVNKNFKSDFRYLFNRHCWKRSEAHRQAVALRRTPAYHGPHYHHHRRHRTVVYAGAYYTRDTLQCSPVATHRAMSVPMRPPPYSTNGTCSQCTTYGSMKNHRHTKGRGTTGGSTGTLVKNLHCVNNQNGVRSSRKNFQVALEYSSYSEV
ncbi:putative Tachykinin-like peptides receptor 99D [Hypsibius exemplaris]|uniref:Tachykinin-like peptides receptor 99D n=1 Tax=Hypsibius exemplaris TaxID=2072580 RepID=A0A1W0XBE6_HYPEX|nr:putative Tachykinin-like peptides receptor 99D [Hypsibius exemplaris]